MQPEEFTKFDILAWWKGRKTQFPVLATMARDLLSVQASAVASESAFSTSGRTIPSYFVHRHHINEFKFAVIRYGLQDFEMNLRKYRDSRLNRMKQGFHVYGSPYVSPDHELKPEPGDDVATIKQRCQDFHGDGVEDSATASGRGRLKEDLESST
ncbi:zinc finger BED domain-containing protein RICESLEEPER 2 [Tanacetum coccineum]|uniref:Zinc finger BED domain-containing protein RICESLEEPER 2 n=1 Tax=Tanacetum coccineum TaxID=301880 RepID=A0ABQ5ACJ2_9ASTR